MFNEMNAPVELAIQELEPMEAPAGAWTWVGRTVGSVVIASVAYT